MKSTGIIAEFNPFHNGHLYHLEETRKLTGSDFLIAVMSGDFTQRGFPAVYRKYMRTRSALLSGADLVIEMPVFGTLAAAADFADCGVSLLAAAGIADFLSFGSECGNLAMLKEQSARAQEETAGQSDLIKKALRTGISWPKARAMAYEGSGGLSSSPNDILGMEYLRALNKYHAPMTPVTVKRTDPGYHSDKRSGSFASAFAIRQALEKKDERFLSDVLPEAHFSALKEEGCPEIRISDFDFLYNYRLYSMSPDELFHTAGMPEALARRIDNSRLCFDSAKNRIQTLKSRQDTYTKVSRCLANAALGITKEDQESFKALQSAPWIRILGFRRQAAPLLAELKKRAQVPVVTKTADAKNLLSEKALRLFEKNLQASELYRMACEQKTGRPMKNEYTRSLIIL